MDRSGLQLCAQQMAPTAEWTSRLSYFCLFFWTSFSRGGLKWSQQKMIKKRLCPVSWEEFQTWLHLKMAALLKRLNNLESYRHTDMFMGIKDVWKVMGRTRVKEARTNVCTDLCYDQEKPAMFTLYLITEVGTEPAMSPSWHTLSN